MSPNLKQVNNYKEYEKIKPGLQIVWFINLSYSNSVTIYLKCSPVQSRFYDTSDLFPRGDATTSKLYLKRKDKVKAKISIRAQNGCDRKYS